MTTPSHMELLRAGMEASKAGRKADARAHFLQAAELSPHSESVWKWLAFVASGAEEAESFAQRALDINPDSVWSRNFLRQIKKREQVTERPCPFCGTVSDSMIVRCAHCKSLVSVWDVESFLANEGADREVLLGAIERFRSSAGDQHGLKRSWSLGIAYLNLKDLPAALEHLRRAGELNPDSRQLRSQVRDLERRVRSAAAESTETVSPSSEATTKAADVTADTPDAGSRPSVERQLKATVSPAETAVRRKPLADAPTKPVAEPTESTKKSVMIVDDSATVRKMIAMKLDRLGYDTMVAENGMEGLAKVQERVPDLILLDIEMPHLDGYKLCRLLKQSEASRDVPVVMLSGRDGFIDKVRSRRAGAIDYLTKPVNFGSLRSVVQKRLSDQGSEGSG